MQNENLSQLQKRNILIGIAKGMSFLHSKDIIHRDLKCANILIDNNYVPKVADLDVATKKLTSDQQQHTKRVGTSYYIVLLCILGSNSY